MKIINLYENNVLANGTETMQTAYYPFEEQFYTAGTSNNKYLYDFEAGYLELKLARWTTAEIDDIAKFGTNIGLAGSKQTFNAGQDFTKYMESYQFFQMLYDLYPSFFNNIDKDDL